MLKRMYDIVFAVSFIIVISPFWLIIAVIIKMTSRGPVIYKAQRVGRNARPFTLYKFRTMRVESGDIPVTTLNNDDRIYPFGNFLRKSKLDETLQVINILLGQMSVVGPRPEDASIAEKIYVGHYLRIYETKPGLTSPASLFDYTYGKYYETQEQYIAEFLPVKLEMEVYYVEHKNIWYDIKLTAKTAKTVIQVLLGKKEFPYPREYAECVKASINERQPQETIHV
ncbi:MAG: sugar transferase [Oscillospiraceae bacterium]|nr:sugar transferase [Oscillospiraceae bacterium]MDD4413164.1 sugar transferase [Oscillospiraceae bacterium]